MFKRCFSATAARCIYNKAVLVGNIGKDPVFVPFPATDSLPASGIWKFSLATTRSFKKGDEWRSETDWHQIETYKVFCH